MPYSSEKVRFFGGFPGDFLAWFEEGGMCIALFEAIQTL